jgi:hypothetical protein
MTNPSISDDPFYASIGRAITEWASVEQSLYRIFLSALDGADEHAASAAFYAVLGFGTKLDMTSAALQVRLGRSPVTAGYSHFLQPHPILDRWLGVKGQWDRNEKSLYGQISSLSKERNKLAHYPVIINHLQDSKRPELRKTQYSASNMRAIFDDGNAYDVERIEKMREAFKTLFDEMEAYILVINETLGQLPISTLSQNRVLDPRP